MESQKTSSTSQRNSTQAGAQESYASLFAEKKRVEQLSRIRELVFGSLDGLLVPLGVVSGVAGGTGSSKAVLVAGLAESFAGALSMGAGEFISSRSEAQVQVMEINKELSELRTEPVFEQQEMVRLFEYEGVDKPGATHLTETLVKYPESYHKTMVEKELGLQMDVKTVKIPEALTMSVSYIIGSVFPLAPYFFLPVYTALPVSIALTVVALIVVGVIRGRLAKLSIGLSILEIVAVGVVSAGGGYLLGTIIPQLLGLSS